MYDIPDNEFDDLIKRSLKENDSPMDPRAWKAMEKFLDKEDRKPLFYYYILSGILILALLSGSVFFFYENQDNSADRSGIASNNTNNKLPLKTKSHNNIINESAGTSLSEKECNTEIEKPRVQSASTNRIDKRYLDKKTPTSVINNSDHNHGGNNIKTFTAFQENNFNQNHFSPLDSFVRYGKADQTEEIGSNIIDKANVTSSERDSQNDVIKSLALANDDSSGIKIILPLKDSSNIKSGVEKEEKKSEESKRLMVSINLVMGPDFSTTKDFNFYKSGFNTGLLSEIYFSKRISFIAGVIYGKKIYATEGYDYKTSDTFWPSSARPEEVKANCSVLDIPINLRYKLFIKEKYNIFISAGLSSYFMMKEKYNYDYEINQSGLLQSWEVKYKNFHALKIGNISFGYERYFGQTWSLQIEPYAKIPLSGIGFGKIKLISTGLSFSLKHYFK